MADLIHCSERLLSEFSISSLELERRGILPLRLTGGGVLDEARSLPRLRVSGMLFGEDGWLRLADPVSRKIAGTLRFISGVMCATGRRGTEDS